MSKNSAQLYEYIENGKTQKAIARDHEKSKIFQQFDRVLLELVDDDLQPLKDDSGKRLISLKHKKDLKLICFVD